MVASQHRPLDPLWKPGVWHEGSSRTTTCCHRHTRGPRTGLSRLSCCCVLCVGDTTRPGPLSDTAAARAPCPPSCAQPDSAGWVCSHTPAVVGRGTAQRSGAPRLLLWSGGRRLPPRQCRRRCLPGGRPGGTERDLGCLFCLLCHPSVAIIICRGGRLLSALGCGCGRRVKPTCLTTV